MPFHVLEPQHLVHRDRGATKRASESIKSRFVAEGFRFAAANPAAALRRASAELGSRSSKLNSELWAAGERVTKIAESRDLKRGAVPVPFARRFVAAERGRVRYSLLPAQATIFRLGISASLARATVYRKTT